MSITTLSTTIQIAKKNHVCDWCGLHIKTGNRYERSNNVYDGDFYSWKNHLECLAVARYLQMFDDADDGVTSDMFSEAIDAEYDNIMIKHHNELYESDKFRYPPWRDRFLFVLDFYNIEHTLRNPPEPAPLHPRPAVCQVQAVCITGNQGTTI